MAAEPVVKAKGAVAPSRFSGVVRLVVGLILLVVAAELLSEWSPAAHTFAISTLINVMIVVGLFIFIGNSGVVSFGQISFMAIGAYATGLLTTEVSRKAFLLPDLPHWIESLHLATFPALVLVGVAVAVFAALVGIPLMRLSGLSASIATLSLLIVVNVLITQSDSITGGNQVFVGVPLTTTTEVAAAGACFAIVVAALFGRSRIGLRLRASRDDPPAARACGIGITRERVIAFGFSGGLIAIAGALYAHQLGSFGPTNFYFELTFITLAMLVVGGIFSLEGAVVGAILISVVEELLGRLENGEGLGPIHLTLHDGVTAIVLAIIVILVMIFRPAGLVGGRGGGGESEEVADPDDVEREPEPPTSGGRPRPETGPAVPPL
jgi:branched-chain amino acid transport system permease protein